jgi:exonuclease III
MNHPKTWNVLDWNVRGINSDKKWNSIRDKIVESRCEIVCLQETKESFDLQFIKKFCPSDFDSFHFLPSIGASGGILVVWKSSSFLGNPVFTNAYAISIEFTSKLSNDTWILTTVYAPCTHTGKREFLEWFGGIQMPDDVHWLITGDFNLIRKPEDRNK